MIQEFLLPDLGEGLAEAEILHWLVAPGETVTLNQPLAEVETAKAVVELPSPHEGTVAKLFAEAGETVAVGAPLISFEVAGTEGDEGASDERAADSGDAPTTNESDTTEAAPPTLVGYGAATTGKGRPARRARRATAAAQPPLPSAGMTGGDTAVLDRPTNSPARTGVSGHDLDHPVRRERPRSTPPVRTYARRLGVDLEIVASALGDRLITREDVDAFAGQRGSSLPDSAPPASLSAPSHAAARPPASTDAAMAARGARAETRIPVRGVRKATADAMVRSAFTAPHVTVFHTVDVTATMQLVAELRADRSLEGARIGVLAVVAKAVCLALGAVPELNARWSGESGEIVQQHYVDLGIAAATDRGLLVPVIRDADRLSLSGLAQALADLAETARAGRTTPESLSGGTFSISNIGVFGVDGGTPILPPGQTGILAVGAVRKQPWEHRGEIALRDVATLSLSFDHRLVDGAEGSRFLRTVADVLEQPGRAMLFS